ncbi:MAG: type III pantothenate kinase [bacterium]
MLLALDVGNTNIVVGVFEGENLKTHFRVSTALTRTADEYGQQIISLLKYSGIEQQSIKDVIVSNVVPPLADILRVTARKYFNSETLFIEPGMKVGMNIKYENPREVGADRIVNAVAAIALYGTPVIVVDFGTATTFCYVNEAGDYLGGCIAPGIGISIEALFRAAAKLSRVEVKKPEHLIGRNTVEAMQSGIYYGFVGQVDEIVRRLKKEIKCNPKVIATGGYASLIAGDSETIDEVQPLLTLEGLRLIYNKNRTLPV